MSQQNVEIVRAAIALYQQPGGIELLARGELDFGLIDPDVEWDASGINDMVPDLAGVYRGHEGVRTYWRRWCEAWRDLQFDVRDIREAGDNVVALIENQRQWGRHTGIATELPPWAMVFTFGDGKLVRWCVFPDHVSALEAVGLEE
jgi:ketosteroid isomerase-like protein